jgi:hypothetical protein
MYMTDIPEYGIRAQNHGEGREIISYKVIKRHIPGVIDLLATQF